MRLSEHSLHFHRNPEMTTVERARLLPESGHASLQALLHRLDLVR